MNAKVVFRPEPSLTPKVVSGRLCVDKNANKISIQSLNGPDLMIIKISDVEPLGPKPTSRLACRLKLGLKEEGQKLYQCKEIEFLVEPEDMVELYKELSNVLPKFRAPKRTIGSVSSNSKPPSDAIQNRLEAALRALTSCPRTNHNHQSFVTSKSIQASLHIPLCFHQYQNSCELWIEAHRNIFPLAAANDMREEDQENK